MKIANEVNHIGNDNTSKVTKVADVLFDEDEHKHAGLTFGEDPKWVELSMRFSQRDNDGNTVHIAADDKWIGNFEVGSMSAKAFSTLTIHTLWEQYVYTT